MDFQGFLSHILQFGIFSRFCFYKAWKITVTVLLIQDLKPANLLISKEGVLKIADLGLGRMFWTEHSRPYSHQVATRWYRAPELLYGARYYTEAVDLWAVGCILGELLTNSPLFPVSFILLMFVGYPLFNYILLNMGQCLRSMTELQNILLHICSENYMK